MNTILQEVIAVNKMTMAELRRKYKDIFNQDAPLTANRQQLIPKIAYEIQTMALGGLTPNAIRMMENFNKGKIPQYAQRKTRVSLPAGTLITKEYRGQTYSIKVTESDFIMSGIHYPSLSKIAKVITGGTNWNVKRFFKIPEIN